jgi:hypothetical protein
MASQGRGVKAPRALSLSAFNRNLQIWKINMSNQPAHKIKIGLITATIWDNSGFHSVDITRSYKDADSQLKNTSGYFQSDLLNVAKCAERAEIWISRQVSTRN